MSCVLTFLFSFKKTDLHFTKKTVKSTLFNILSAASLKLIEWIGTYQQGD